MPLKIHAKPKYTLFLSVYLSWFGVREAAEQFIQEQFQQIAAITARSLTLTHLVHTPAKLQQISEITVISLTHIW